MTKYTDEQIKKMWNMVDKTSDGKIKDFSVPDAHNLRVVVYRINEVLQTIEMVNQDVLMLPSIDALYTLLSLVDPQDGRVYGRKFALHDLKGEYDEEVINKLKSKGEAVKIIKPLRFEYILTKAKFADELRHKG